MYVNIVNKISKLLFLIFHCMHCISNLNFYFIHLRNLLKTKCDTPYLNCDIDLRRSVWTKDTPKLNFYNHEFLEHLVSKILSVYAVSP